MKTRTNRINKLKLEIQDLEKQIQEATNQHRGAFAHRLKKMKELKQEKLEKWIFSS